MRRNESGAQILSHDAVRELLRDPVDLTGIDALQLYVQGKGGNATRYICEYRYDRSGSKANTTVWKKAYVGVDGLGGNKWGYSGEKPVAHPILSQTRWLNERLGDSTRELAQRLETNSGLTILHMHAQYVLSEAEVPWFIGCTDIITQKIKPALPFKDLPPQRVNVSPTMQAGT